MNSRICFNKVIILVIKNLFSVDPLIRFNYSTNTRFRNIEAIQIIMFVSVLDEYIYIFTMYMYSFHYIYYVYCFTTLLININSKVTAKFLVSL